MLSEEPPLIVHVVHSLKHGGMERTLIALLCAFDRTRFRHVVVTLRDAGPLSEHLPEHVACRALHASGRCWSTWLPLARFIRARRAAIVHARNTGCWFDAIVAGLLSHDARLVLGFHGLLTEESFTRRQRRRGGGRSVSWRLSSHCDQRPIGP